MKLSIMIRTFLLGSAFLAAAAAFLVTPTNAFVTPTTTTTTRIATAALNMVPSTDLKQPGTAKMDKPWNELGFEFRPTNSHIQLTYKDGKWGKGELVKVGCVVLVELIRLCCCWCLNNELQGR